MNEVDKYKLGARFVCDDYYGTIKYVGPVPPTEGIWLGVEWDDISRGKHNGTYEGRVYFKTKGQTSGSFVRCKKVDLGITFLEAILERYNTDSQSIENVTEANNLCIFTKNNLVLPIEAVGYEKIGRKQNQLNQLLVAGLPSMKISETGSQNEILNTTPNLKELVLSHNLLSNWKDVINIAQQLRFLKILDLSGNKIAWPTFDQDESLQCVFPNLEQLILNKMDCNWQQIFYCFKLWPSLKNLQVSFNSITSLEISPDYRLHHLEELCLGHNEIKSWFEILKLGNLPKLKHLNLESVGLSDIMFEDVPSGEKTSLFPSLETINLQDNSIGKWSSMNELNKLQVLSRLSFQRNPLWELDKFDNVWQIIIAKLSGLRNLNGSKVSPDERRGAELDYIKKYAKEWFAFKNGTSESNDIQTFIYQHPRYCQLVEVFGPPDEHELAIQRSVLKNNLIKIEITCPQKQNFKPLKKSLPDSMTVEKLVLLVKRLLKQDDVVLTVVSRKDPNYKVHLDNDQRLLSFYVDDGDQIVVSWD